MPANHSDIEGRLWDAADELRANSKLKASEYSVPVLGLIFLKYADHRFGQAQQQIEGTSSGRRRVGKTDYQAKGVLYLPEQARFANLLELTESQDIGKAINDAMRAIEQENEDLRDVLPKTYNRLENPTLATLLKLLNSIPMDVQGDVFGRIYEYFLGAFAMSEGQKGGEFFTPTSLVRLIVEVIEPFHGRILDPACGSGGMFAQSARFVAQHRNGRTLTPGPSPTGRGRREAGEDAAQAADTLKAASTDISIYGQERVAETVRLCRMNLAVHGLSGDIRQGNTYYEDLHQTAGTSKGAGHGRFDFVMANPPFNVDRIDKEKLKDDPRFPYGLPRTDNGNYVWIQIFASALNAAGRAGFVMANSASDARGSELEIRKKMLQDRMVDVMVAVGTNMFYTVTLPCTLWFLDRGKGKTPRKDQVLFIDARHLYHQIDRAHREFLPEQIEFLANIARLYRGEPAESESGSADLMKQHFPKGKYQDVPGLCKVADIAEIEVQGWSLNPGRYVGVTATKPDDFDFYERLEELNEELEVLNAEAHEFETTIAGNVAELLDV